MYPGFKGEVSNGGVRRVISRSSGKMRYSWTASRAVFARSSDAAPERTAQLWVIESIVHSGFTEDPSGRPESKNARRYHRPSHPSLSRFSRIHSAFILHNSANAGSW